MSPGTGIPRPRAATAGTSGRLGPRGVRPAGWWFDALLLAIFLAITIALLNGALLNLDSATVHWSDNHRNALTWWTGYALSCLGQGGPLTYGTLAVAVILAWRRRTFRPVLIPIAGFLLTYLGVGPIKVWSNRAVPHHGPVEMFGLAHGPYSMAYPSGHTANAIVWFGALLLLIGPYLPRWFYWLVRIGAPATVAITMVYIDYHWLTDVVAAIPLGMLLSRVMYRVPWERVPLPPWRRRRAADVQQDIPPQATRTQPLVWATLPQMAARARQRTGPLARLWSGTRPTQPEHTEAGSRRRPATAGPGGRPLHLSRGHGTAAPRPQVRLRDEID